MPIDRSLMTVLFTDIADSTQRASELGDRGWRRLLDRHDKLVRAELARSGRHEVDTAGDGFFATFDTPANAIACAVAILRGADELGLVFGLMFPVEVCGRACVVSERRLTR